MNSQLDQLQVLQDQEAMTSESYDSEEDSFDAVNTLEDMNASQPSGIENTSPHSKMKINIPKHSATTDMFGEEILGGIREEHEGALGEKKRKKKKRSRLESIAKDKGLFLIPSPIKGEIEQSDSNIQTSSNSKGIFFYLITLCMLKMS